MKIKFLFLLCLVLSVISCNSYRDFISIEDRYIEGERDQLINGKFLSVLINKSPLMLTFDTGAQRSIINDIGAIGGKEILNSDKYRGIRTMVLPNGEKEEVGLLKLDSLKLNSIQSINRKFMIVSQKRLFQCQDTTYLQNQGYYGIDNIAESELPIVLDYANNTIGINASPDMTRFKEVDAFFERKYIGVRLTIKGEPISLHFDTGNTGGIILVKDKLPNKNPTIDYEVELLNLLGNESLVSLKMERSNFKDVTSKELSFDKLDVMLTNDVTNHNMGLEFISQFDWVIDFKNERLFARPHQDQNLAPSYDGMSKPFLVVPSNNELIISYKKTNAGSYQIGDAIVQIDDTPITSENICYWFKTLNTIPDWSKYRFKFRPVH